MNADQIQNNIKESFLSVFPHSYVACNKHSLGSGFACHFALGKDKTEWAHGIIDNDPLRMTLHYWPDSDIIEIKASFIVKPENTYMYCSSVKLRKKTIKADNATVLNFLKYFSELRFTIIQNQANLLEKEKDFIMAKLG